MQRRQRLCLFLQRLPLLLLAAGPALPAHAARGELREIVQQRCLPDWLQHRDPAPCLRVALPDDPSSGPAAEADYALLADRKGGAHFLVIPVRTLGGIESPELLTGRLPNYFAAAWQVRGVLAARVAHAVPATAVALAINSRYSRGQDQLHIHIECQGAALHATLGANASRLTGQWMPLSVGNDTWLARRVTGSSLQHADPFRLLAAGVPDAGKHMALYTLIVAGMRFRDGPGFALLARRAILRGGEALLDARCTVAAP